MNKSVALGKLKVKVKDTSIEFVLFKNPIFWKQLLSKKTV